MKARCTHLGAENEKMRKYQSNLETRMVLNKMNSNSPEKVNLSNFNKKTGDLSSPLPQKNLPGSSSQTYPFHHPSLLSTTPLTARTMPQPNLQTWNGKGSPICTQTL